MLSVILCKPADSLAWARYEIILDGPPRTQISPFPLHFLSSALPLLCSSSPLLFLSCSSPLFFLSSPLLCSSSQLLFFSCSSSCQLWPVRLLPQKASSRWATVIAQLPTEHNGAVAGHMDYHACLLVDHVKLGIVRITTINVNGRKSVTTDGKSSEGHSAKNNWRK